MARNRWILSVAVFLLTIVALVSQVEARKIRVGIGSVGIPAILYLISRENGYYQQEGLDVEIIVMQSTLAHAGVVAGDLDFSTIPVAGRSRHFVALPWSTYSRAMIGRNTPLFPNPRFGDQKILREREWQS